MLYPDKIIRYREKIIIYPDTIQLHVNIMSFKAIMLKTVMSTLKQHNIQATHNIPITIPSISIYFYHYDNIMVS